MKYPIVKHGSVQARDQVHDGGKSNPGGYLVENKRDEEHRRALIVRSYLTAPTPKKIIDVRI